MGICIPRRYMDRGHNDRIDYEVKELNLAPDQDLSAWCAETAKDALSGIGHIVSKPTFSLRDAAQNRERLAAVGAALLTREDEDTITSEAYFPIEAMQIDLMDVHGRSARRSAHALGFAILPFVMFAKAKLRLRLPPGAADILAQLLERHAEPYFASDLDVNPFSMLRRCWELYDTIESGDAQRSVVCVEALHAELNSAPAPTGQEEFRVDHAEIKRRNAPFDPRTDILGTGVGLPPPFDDSVRIARLVARVELMKDQGRPASEIARIQTEIDLALSTHAGIDPSRLYPED